MVSIFVQMNCQRNNLNFAFYVGTTQTRGQIPHILYYSHPPDSEGENTNKAIPETQARKCTLAMTTTIMQRVNEIFALAREKAEEVVASEVLGNATFVTTLLPLLMAYITPLATFDPRVIIVLFNTLFFAKILLLISFFIINI